MVVDLQQNMESINVTMSCPWGEQPQQFRATPKKDRRKPKVPVAAETPHFPLAEHLCARPAPFTLFPGAVCRC